MPQLTPTFREAIAQPDASNSNLKVGTKILVHIVWPLERRTLVYKLSEQWFYLVASFFFLKLQVTINNNIRHRLLLSNNRKS